jgi:aspartyl protease family protein
MLMRYLSLFVGISMLAILIAWFAGTGSQQVEAELTAEPETHVTMIKTDHRREPTQEAIYGSEVTLGRADDSHFYADVDIDGTMIRMIVDTGASTIALTRSDAEAIGINVDALADGGTAATAGGDVAVKPTMLDRVEIDGIAKDNVQAVVVDTEMRQSLLGQSFLSRLDSVTVEGDKMILR